MMEIRKVKADDCSLLADLALELWPNHTHAALQEEFKELIFQGDAALLIAYEQDAPVGFCQCQLRRDYVEGAQSSPVGYLEGIYVRPNFRRRGIARALLKSGQQWAKEQGCFEFASDCELENTESMQFHLSSGFQEANRIICFLKKI